MYRYVSGHVRINLSTCAKMNKWQIWCYMTISPNQWRELFPSNSKVCLYKYTKRLFWHQFWAKVIKLTMLRGPRFHRNTSLLWAAYFFEADITPAIMLNQLPTFWKQLPNNSVLGKVAHKNTPTHPPASYRLRFEGGCSLQTGGAGESLVVNFGSFYRVITVARRRGSIFVVTRPVGFAVMCEHWTPKGDCKSTG